MIHEGLSDSPLQRMIPGQNWKIEGKTEWQCQQSITRPAANSGSHTGQYSVELAAAAAVSRDGMTHRCVTWTCLVTTAGNHMFNINTVVGQAPE